MIPLRPSKLTIATLFLLLWVFLPYNASASIDYQIPVTVNESTGQVLCNVPPYSAETFTKYQIAFQTKGNILVDTTTSGTGLCTGSLTASRDLGGNFNTGAYGSPGLSTTTAGTFYVFLYTSPTVIYGYMQFSCGNTGVCFSTQGDTTIIPTIPIQKNIEILNPTYGTTTATTTFNVQIHFKTPFSIDFRPTTTRTYEIVDAVTGELNYRSTTTIPANSAENLLVNENATTTIGSKFIRAFYADIQGNIYSEVDEVFFNVATNTYFIATGLLTPIDNPYLLTQIDCGTFEFGCQVQKAITFLFVPSNDVLDKFKNLWQTIAEKKPFGYVTVTINQLEALDVSGSSAFTLGTIPFMDSLFTPLRTAVSTILWALFAIYFYQRRLKHLDI